jgi:hypothetical protein
VELKKRVASLSLQEFRQLRQRMPRVAVQTSRWRIEKRPPGERAPLSSSQQELWRQAEQHPDGPGCNTQCALEIEGTLDREAVRAALCELVSRHEVLRTRVLVQDGVTWAETHDPDALGPEIGDFDYTHLESTAQAQRLKGHRQWVADRRFDLTRDMLIRLDVLRMSPRRHVLLFVLPLFAADCWSLQILVKEFAALYSALREGKSAALLPLRVQYGDFAFWERNWLQGDALGAQLEYWKRTLRDLPRGFTVPLDKPRPSRLTAPSRTFASIVNPSLARSIRERCRVEDVTLFMLLQTAFVLLLGRLSGASDIVMGTFVKGRLHEDLEPLIGFFTNVLVLRTDLSGTPSAENCLARNRAVILGAFEHQSLPYARLVTALENENGSAGQPLYRIVFVLQAGEDADAPSQAIRSLPLEGEQSLHRADLQLCITEGPAELLVSWTYSPELFDELSIEYMASSFTVLLEEHMSSAAGSASI